jgi:starvation-inducible DNA-binding protein
VPAAMPGLGVEDPQRICSLLNVVLADEFVLTVKTRNHHWNLVGPRFPSLHKMFDDQYNELDDAIDEVAERVRALGGRALGSMAEFLRETRLEETEDELDSDGMVEDLARDHERLAAELRADIKQAGSAGDEGTVALLGELLVRHEKMAWMLRATLGHAPARDGAQRGRRGRSGTERSRGKNEVRAVGESSPRSKAI